MLPRVPVVLLLVGLAGCGNAPTEPLLDALPRPLSPAELVIVDAGNRFTFELFRETARTLPPAANAMLSPLSASMALGMALNGAVGQTFDDMRQTLRVSDLSLAEINQGYRDLIRLVLGLDRSVDVAVANSIWANHSFALLPPFIEAGRTWFDAQVESIDFGSPTALVRINGWVNEQTRGRIPTLLDEIDPAEQAFLINAIYFKGAWRIQFDPDKTGPAPFHGADGVARSVPMMRLEAPIRYTATVDYQAVDLLYGNGAFAMTVLLPALGQTPATLIETMGPGEWRALTQAFHEQRVPLSLPRFRFQYARSLKPDLETLGMGIAFDGARADFSAMASAGPQRIYLTRVLQKTFVEVNEEGTEAAAATSVGVGVTSAPPSMVVDRPFLFVIRERLSETVVFIGLVNQLGGTGG